MVYFSRWKTYNRDSLSQEQQRKGSLKENYILLHAYDSEPYNIGVVLLRVAILIDDRRRRFTRAGSRLNTSW